jgi:hypothetical protein
MMPTPRERVYHFRRKTAQGYGEWFAQRMGVEGEILISHRSRGLIEEAVLSQASVYKPAAKSPDIETDVTPETVTDVTVEDIPDSEEFPNDISYDAMTLTELREECKRRGLVQYGTKAEVALRLRRDDEGIEETTTAESEAPADEAAAEEQPDTPDEESAVTEVENNASSGQEQTVETNE